MSNERRNDIGTKVLISVVALLVITIIGFSIGANSKTDVKANINSNRLTRVETTQEYMKTTVAEIKTDVKFIKRNMTRKDK